MSTNANAHATQHAPAAQAAQNAQAQAKAQLHSASVKLHYYVSQLDKELSKYPALNRLEAQTKVPKAHAAIALGTALFLSIFFNIGAQVITNLIGLVLPAYYSVQAIESAGHADDVQWLTYWISFATFNFVENFSTTLLRWFPYYYVFKTLAIVYLVFPQTRGAETVYNKLVRPLVFQGRPAVRPTTADDLKARLSTATNGPTVL